MVCFGFLQSHLTLVDQVIVTIFQSRVKGIQGRDEKVKQRTLPNWNDRRKKGEKRQRTVPSHSWPLARSLKVYLRNIFGCFHDWNLRWETQIMILSPRLQSMPFPLGAKSDTKTQLEENSLFIRHFRQFTERWRRRHFCTTFHLIATLSSLFISLTSN